MSDTMEATVSTDVDVTTGLNAVQMWAAELEKPEPEPEKAGDDSQPEQVDGEPEAKDPGEQEQEQDQEKEGEDEDPKGVVKKINKEVGRRKAAEEAAERLRVELENTKRQLMDTQAKAVAATLPPKPELHQYQTHEEWTEALTEWKLQERDHKRQQQAAEEWREAQTKARQERARGIVNEGMERFKDFREVAFSYPMPEPMLDVLMECDDPAGVAFDLGKHQEEAIKIAQMPPVKQAIALAKLDAQLAKLKSQPTNKAGPTKAPPPVKSLKGGSESPNDDPDKMPIERFMSKRMKGLL